MSDQKWIKKHCKHLPDETHKMIIDVIKVGVKSKKALRKVSKTKVSVAPSKVILKPIKNVSSGPYRETFNVSTWSTDDENIKFNRIITFIFDDEAAAESSEADFYDSCREKVVAWLAKHHPNENMATDGEDIECDGSPAENDDVLDFRTIPPAARLVCVETNPGPDYKLVCDHCHEMIEIVKRDIHTLSTSYEDGIGYGAQTYSKTQSSINCNKCDGVIKSNTDIEGMLKAKRIFKMEPVIVPTAPCPKCESAVPLGMRGMTEMYFKPFLCDKGKRHQHDGNKLTGHLTCPKCKHFFMHYEYPHTCSSCDWKQSVPGSGYQGKHHKIPVDSDSDSD